MNTLLLCAGLSLSGLCIPLPGHSRATLESAGWTIFSEEDGEFITTTLASGPYKVVIDISLENGVVVAVQLAEVDESSDSPLEAALRRTCKKIDRREVCAVGGVQFIRFPCAGGTLLLGSSLPIGVIATEKARCKEWEVRQNGQRRPK